jgi:sugar-specific transcriptional regulator TrmB
MKISTNIRKYIDKAGLSEKEALIYSTLLSMGGSGYPSKIALKSGLKRSTAYKILLDLSIKGLVNEIEKKNKIYYQLEKPQKLLKYAKDRVQIAENYVEEIQKILPDLDGLFSLNQGKPKVTYFEGVDGVLEVYKDHINVTEKYEMLGWANAGRLRDFLPRKFLKDYVAIKEKIGITTRGILPGDEAAMSYQNEVYGSVKKSIYPKPRFINPKLFPFEGEITIYGKNKISIAKVGDVNLIGVIIEDEVIHGMMKMIFELSWKGVGK